MNRSCSRSSLVVIAVCFLALLLIKTVECMASDYLLTDAELDDLLAPIALYPDPLLAQMLPASTYLSEVIDAAAWIGGGGDASAIDVPNWDESVKAIAFYPDILNMMTDNIDWTSDLGYAFLYQPDDVMSSIQRLRWQARSLGSLESDDQETVSIDGDYLEIIPAQPEYIYVPQYNPTIIYVRRWSPGMAPFMTFGRRMPIGSWLSMDFDWHKHHVIYHGWNRPGWVNNAKRYVHITNVYINKSRPHINQAWLHDASHGNPDRYRTAQTGGVRGGSTHSSEVRGRDTTLTKPATAVFGPKGDVRTFSNRGKESLGVSGIRPAAPVTVIGKPQTTPLPRSPQTFSNRGKESLGAGGIRSTTPITVIGKPQTRPSPRKIERPATPGTAIGFSQPGTAHVVTQPVRAPSGVFGGYRGTNEATVLSNRGQTSRQNAGMSSGTAPSSRVGRVGTPAVRQSPVDKKLR